VQSTTSRKGWLILWSATTHVSTGHDLNKLCGVTVDKAKLIKLVDKQIALLQSARDELMGNDVRRAHLIEILITLQFPAKEAKQLANRVMKLRPDGNIQDWIHMATTGEFDGQGHVASKEGL